MFKKRNVSKTKQAIRKRSIEQDETENGTKSDEGDEKNQTRNKDEDDEEEEDTSSVLDAIQKTRKKQKLLAMLPLTTLDGRSGTNRSTEITGSTANAAAADAIGSGEALSLLAQKHQQAMEDYIDQHISKQKSNTKAATEDVELQSTTTVATTATTQTEATLYQELAMAVSGGVTNSNSSATATKNDKDTSFNTTLDGDVGTGGAMLVGGTGITEVVLPIQQRLESLQQQQQQQQNVQLSSSSRRGMSSAVPTTSTSSRLHSSSNLLPSNTKVFGRKSYMQQQSLTSSKSSPSVPTSNANENHQEDSTNVSKESERIGFAAVRGMGSTTSGTFSNTNSNDHAKHNSNKTTNTSHSKHSLSSTHANDDRVFSNFLARHRERNKNK